MEVPCSGEGHPQARKKPSSQGGVDWNPPTPDIRQFAVPAVIVKHIILSYAFKMRQDYLSTSYLDQKYLPSERSERGRYELIQVTCAEIILSHFEGIWWYFSHTFHYLTDEISWKYEKTCQSGTWMLVPPICVRLTFSPRTFTRITLAMCALPTLPT